MSCVSLPAAVCVEDELRLADGGADFRGRVEICRNEMWGTVCNEMWSASDANVVCRQLGYSRHSECVLKLHLEFLFKLI